LYTPCILDCALRFLIKFSYLSKKKENAPWRIKRNNFKQ